MNKKTIKNTYLLPMIDDLFDKEKWVIVFSKIDLRFGYHQMRIKEEYILMITFWKIYGHCKSIILPFVLMNEPTPFKCLMYTCIQQVCNDFSRQHIILSQDPRRT